MRPFFLAAVLICVAAPACREQADPHGTPTPPLPAVPTRAPAAPDDAAPATSSPSSPTIAPHELRPPEAFAALSDPAVRSRALFAEAARVITHPRCVNCHPSDDHPRQLAGEMHEPPVVRGPEGHGIPALRCTTCHQDANAPLSRVPGAPKWALAPIAMAWQHKSVGAICAQLKDPARNGHRTLAQIVDHAAHDQLVAWGWAPGADREPAPGTQATFGALMAAWVDSGAACPEEAKP